MRKQPTENRKIGYYPGCSCSSLGTGRYYGASALAILDKLGVQISEIQGWNCCGSSLYRIVDERGANLLVAKILAKALEGSLSEILTLCPACMLSLKRTASALSTDGELLQEVRSKYSVFGNSERVKFDIRHLIDFLVNDVGEEAFTSRVEKRLEGLRVAAYYGCQITRPYGQFDDPEFPSSLERMISWVGAEPLESPLRTKCCGGMLMLTNEERVLTIIKRILESYVRLGAECIVTACPLCHLNLEMAKFRLGKELPALSDMPIIYFTQLVGLAYNIPASRLGLSKDLANRLSGKIAVHVSGGGR